MLVGNTHVGYLTVYLYGSYYVQTCLFYHIAIIASSVTLTYVRTSSQCFVPQKPEADEEQSGFEGEMKNYLLWSFLA